MNVQFTDKIACIFKHTLALIKENGFHGTPMSMIAKNADVAIGTIYHYFPSKDNLILELFRYCKEQLNDFIFDKLDVDLSYEQQFKHVMECFCRFQIDNIDIFSFLEQFHNSPYNDLANSMENLCKEEENNVINFLLKGMEMQQIKQMDVHVAAAAFIGSIVTLSKSIIYRKTEFNQQHLDQLVDIIWNGVKQ